MTSLWSALLLLLVPLPVGTDRRRRRVPWVTATLIALNVAVYVGVVLYARQYTPDGFPLLHDLIYGPSDPDLFSEWGFLPQAPRPLSLLVSMFLHVSFGHLFWNMAFLWLFGSHVEDALGPVSFLALYLGGGVAAGVLHMAIKWLIPAERATLGEPLVGASGAISAIVAPFAVRYHRAQIKLLWLSGLLARSDWANLDVPALAGLGLWLLQNLAGALNSLRGPGVGGVAYFAHLGGFAFGLVASELGGLLREGRQDYLLEEARLAAQQPALLPVAVAKYQAFLDHSPADMAVRLELADALVRQSPDPDAGRQEAVRELTAAVRAAQKARRWDDALRLCAGADSLGLCLTMPAAERLRLAAAAEEAGRGDTAVGLLRALIAETPDAPEAEMARLKLGQALLRTAPGEARAILQDYLDRHPESAWTARVRELLRRAASGAGD